MPRYICNSNYCGTEFKKPNKMEMVYQGEIEIVDVCPGCDGYSFRVYGMIYGFVGSGKFKDKEFVIKKLNDIINPEVDIIVSGHSPRNKKNNVDIWSEDWANEFCWTKPIIHPADENNKKEYFRRNKKIAQDSDKLVCFINKGRYKSGTWNTIKHFVNKPDFNLNNLIIYNEEHKLWKTDDLPKWILRKMKFIENMKRVSGLF
ncbi:hypothetical protein LCGC14_0560080 [marine sediment metagenome]|uniref:Uncharacterized protein n=1 Tax=marine sediment metagenome TaxID=412755 RepID=A0A0F9U8Q3_9ZZZZ